MNITRINNAPEVYSITSATRPGGARPRPRLTDSTITTDTLVTRSDGTTYIISKTARHTRKNDRQRELLKELARRDRQNKLDMLRHVTSANLPVIDYGE